MFPLLARALSKNSVKALLVFSSWKQYPFNILTGRLSMVFTITSIINSKMSLAVISPLVFLFRTPRWTSKLANCVDTLLWKKKFRFMNCRISVEESTTLLNVRITEEKHWIACLLYSAIILLWGAKVRHGFRSASSSLACSYPRPSIISSSVSTDCIPTSARSKIPQILDTLFLFQIGCNIKGASRVGLDEWASFTGGSSFFMQLSFSR